MTLSSLAALAVDQIVPATAPQVAALQIRFGIGMTRTWFIEMAPARDRSRKGFIANSKTEIVLAEIPEPRCRQRF
jgi:hypothetical protein